MKRHQLEKYLKKHNCILFEHGSKHDIFLNQSNNKTTSVPRHNEIDNFLAKKICKDLNIAQI